MDGILLLKCAAAFAFVMGLMVLFSWFLKKIGLSGQVMVPGARRRLKIVENLPIDHRRRLVLVRCDDREHLLVLGANGESVVERGIPASADDIAADSSEKKEQAHG